MDVSEIALTGSATNYAEVRFLVNTFDQKSADGECLPILRKHGCQELRRKERSHQCMNSRVN